jgi:alpha-tubulin suppressor-like RCC1 family protein
MQFIIPLKRTGSTLLVLLPFLTPAALKAQILPGTLSAGNGHSVLLAPDGSLRWGYNGSGQLGNGSTTTASSPVQAGTATTYAQVAAKLRWVRPGLR